MLDYKNLFDNENIFALLTVAGSIFAYFSIIIVSFGDFSRYVKNEDELKKGNFSLIANLIIFSFFSVFIVVGSDVFLNLRFLDLSSILTSPIGLVKIELKSRNLKFKNTSDPTTINTEKKEKIIKLAIKLKLPFFSSSSFLT